MERAPIHWAIIHKNADIVSLLIDAKCDIETADKVIKTKEKDIKFDHNVFFQTVWHEANPDGRHGGQP